MTHQVDRILRCSLSYYVLLQNFAQILLKVVQMISRKPVSAFCDTFPNNPFCHRLVGGAGQTSYDLRSSAASLLARAGARRR